MRRYPAYKDSGVEWFGEVPEGWRVLPVKAVATCNDEVLPEDTDPDWEIEYLEISGVDAVAGITETSTVTFDKAASRARRKLRDGDVLLSTVRTYLRAIAQVVAPPANMIASTGFAVLRPRGVASRFMGYLFRSEVMISKIIARSVGVSYPAINASEIMSLHLPIPPLPEQTAIATFLDRETAKIDALVAEQRRLIDLLREKRQAVISNAVTKGLNPNANLKPSGIDWLGDVPVGWEVVPIKHLVLPKKDSIKTGPFGSQLVADEMRAGSIKVFNQRNVIDEDFDGGENFISDEKFEELRAFEVFQGDLLLTTRGTIGRTAIVPSIETRGILHPCLIRLQLDGTKMEARFLRALIQESDLVKTQLTYMSNATTIEVIYSYTIANVKVPVPPVDEQSDILSFLAEAVIKFDTLTAAAETAITLLQERRAALISAAVTGKIDVRHLIQKEDEAA